MRELDHSGLQDDWRSAPVLYARTASKPPIMSTTGNDWQKVRLQRFKLPFHELNLDAAHTHRLTLHLAGPILIERTRDGRRDRKWSDAGCSNLIPAGVPATRSFRGQADFLVFHLPRDLIDEVAAESFDIDARRVDLVESMANQDPTIDHFGRLLLAESEAGAGSAGTSLYTDALACGLATHLIRDYSHGSPHTVASPECMVGWRLRQAIDYMHAHIDEELTLVRLSAESGLGPGHFARAFRQATGEPPYKYLIRLRIDLARRLLEHTRTPIIEVALGCGFEQPNHFATMFRKVTGVSPRDYRKRIGKFAG